MREAAKRTTWGEAGMHREHVAKERLARAEHALRALARA
jgi:hypothetical protein